jgi:hypothetical protein
VTIPRAAFTRLSHGASPEDLVKTSFAFPLEREPKESILGEFDLEVIGRYFPEYEHELGRRLGGTPM